jgi:trehalose synthase
MNASSPLGTGPRRALVLAVGRYRHDKLSDLESPAMDAELVQNVLGNPDLGDFTVEELHNPDAAAARGRIFDFFDTAQPEDFLLTFITGHGIRSADGQLYIATIETDPDRLPPTAVPADYIGECINNCQARSLVLVLDCCYAGAFERGLDLRGGSDRNVIMACSAVQLAHASGEPGVEALPSAFARAFLEGISSGDADRDNNGLITVREAYDHAHRVLGESNGRTENQQEPHMLMRFSGDLALARAPVRPGALPRDIAVLIRNGLASARLTAIRELKPLLESSQDAMSVAARSALAGLRSDPDELVAIEASRLLSRSERKPRVSAPARSLRARQREPLWYKSTVFYEVRVGSFADSNADGIGDLHGLCGKLDYLQWLGIGCLLLSPIFDSPLQDDGYDISNFMSIRPELGVLAEFVALVDSAHALGIRVVLDLVLNHTSDRHSWFTQSQQDPGGPYGDFYVWRDAPAIYQDAEPGNVEPGHAAWTYDAVRGQYYWHRFAAHEPDLNFDNPAVQDAMLEIIRYWMDLDVDGFRLTAAPYLYEREGTHSDGLTETHVYLKRLRAEVDRLYPDRMLLADTNHWPADAADYFGDTAIGDECAVVLYTSLMPRIFIAMRQESHQPVSQVLADTPAIPERCQWGVFLRNGEELSIEMVTAEERTYLLAEYAPDQSMRTSRGIRRRLASLVENDRSQLELCTALLLSLPGSPVLYYGDEIGMGDDLALIGSDSLRTPMQWSSDRNAGFSAAGAELLALPVLDDSVYGYHATSVEAQMRGPSSLLRWTKRLIEIRRHNPAFSIGSFALVASTNQAVLSYIRESHGNRVLCVANFSRFSQPVELDLGPYADATPVELLGGTRFFPISTQPYRLALGGHGFSWFSLMATEHVDEPAS